MKKHFGKISIILLALMLIFGMASCATIKEADDDTVKAIGIEIDSATIPASAVAGGLDLSSIKVKVYMSDETSTSIDLALDMVSINDRSKLYLSGQQLITVVYQGCTTKFQINFAQAPKEKFTLTVEGGELVAVNERTLLPDEKPQIVNNKFTVEYDKDTIVTVKWISVEGYEFFQWTDNGNPMNNSTTVDITMNKSHYYKAETTALVSLVYFYTNGATVTNLAPKRTNLLNETDINNGNVLLREGYVFDGWTTTAVDETTAVNSNAPKINFFDNNNKPKPYKVEIETRLYATWRPLGIHCRREDGPNGTTVFVIDKYELAFLSDKLKAPTTLEIPNEYVNEMGVRGRIVGIDANAFISKDASMLKSISIPETITNIADGAFRALTQLTTIISESLSYTVDSSRALYTSDYEKLIAYPSARIAINYEVHQNTRQIAPYAFKDALLGKIVLNSNLQEIGNEAFNSAHIDRINFDTVIATDQTVLGSNLFSSNLRQIIVSPSYLGKFQSYISFKPYLDIVGTVEDTIAIGLNDNTLLFRSIFNENAPDSQLEVEIIGAKRDLSEVTIPIMINRTNVFSVAARAFNYCWYLSNIIFPQENNLDRIGEDAFSDTKWLQSLESKINNDSIIVNKVLYKYLGNSSTYTLPANVTKIAEGAFLGNNKLTSINMSQNNDLIFIGAYAFYNCSNLIGNLVIMPKVETIYNYAFANTKIQNLVLQNDSKLKEIGEYAFANCYYLKSAQLSGNIISIATTAFLYDYSLEKFAMQQAIGTPLYRVYNDILYKCNQAGIANELFTYPAGKLLGVFDVNRPSQDVELAISSIGDNALFFSNIASIIIPDTITGISTNAIYIPGLVYVKFEKPLSNITYKLLFQDDLLGIGKYEPKYIVFDSGTDAEINNFYGHDEQLKLRIPHVSVEYTEFMYDEQSKLLYAFDTSLETPRLSVVKSSRTETEFVIPKDAVKASNELSYFIRYIDKYSFFGNYVSKVTTNSVNDIANFAFYNANNFSILDMKENSSRVYIGKNTFNSYFNNGMLVYIMAGYTDQYIYNWSLDTDTAISGKYLLETGQAIVNFVVNSEAEKWDVLHYYKDDEWKETPIDIYTESNQNNTINANYFPIPTRKGYDFVGWKDERLNFEDMSKNIIDSSIDYFIPFNIDLTAIWEAKVYTVIFKVADGVEMNTTEIQITFDDKSFEYDTPKYPNKKFAYWRDILGNKYGENEDETPSSWIETFTTDSIVFYPVWTDITYVVKYSIKSDEGEACSEESKIITLGNMYEFAIPTKTGYSFEGWTLDELNGQIPQLITDAQGKSLDLWTLSTSSEYIVYPYFKAKQFIVTLKVREDIQIYEIVKNVVFGQGFSFDYNELWEKISDGTVKETYPVELFCGWENALGERITDDSGAGLKWNIANNITLYAIWPQFINSQAEFDAFCLDVDHLSKSIALKSDITLTKPIGDKNNPYMGVFIGNGHKVTYSFNEIYDGYVGMVAINKGTIKNVKLNATINIGSTSDCFTNLYIGGVAGINESRIVSTSNSIVSDIIVDIFINFTPENNHAYIGGIAGDNSGLVQNLSCEVNTITININGQKYTKIEDNITAGSLIGNVAIGSIITSERSAKYYYNDGAYILNDYGMVAEGVTTSWSATKTKNN